MGLKPFKPRKGEALEMANMKTKLIATCRTYDVCELANGSIVISSKLDLRVVKIPPDKAPTWRLCFTEAMDEQEVRDLCVAAMRG